MRTNPTNPEKLSKPEPVKSVPATKAANQSKKASRRKDKRAAAVPVPKLTKSYVPKYEPYDFQAEAIEKINAGNSVLVSAPTGTGKTVLAYAAIWKTISEGGSVVYTAPIKALTNQKIEEFKTDFARMLMIENGLNPDTVTEEEQAKYLETANSLIGIQTGDNSDNVKAPIQIVTTEVYQQQVETGQIKNLRMVIYDELHYLGDPDRGAVWESSLINTPIRNDKNKPVQVLGLSATLGKPERLVEWLNRIKGKAQTDKTTNKVELVRVDEKDRPIKLDFYSFDENNDDLLNTKLEPLVNNSGLPQKDLQIKKAPDALTKHEDVFFQKMEVLTRVLKDNDKLPAIVFSLNRERCDTAAQHIANVHNLKLLSKSDTEKASEMIDSYLDEKENKSLKFEIGAIELLKKGIAVHHAGHLPKYKALVEKLFDEGLIKVVFSTTTLAAGINMPARTTVLTELGREVKIGEEKYFEWMDASLVRQMSGRAGRKGKGDAQGNVVFFMDMEKKEEILKRFIESQPEEIQGSYYPNYINILASLKDSNTKERKFEKSLIKSLAFYNAMFEESDNNMSLRKKLKDQYLSVLDKIVQVEVNPASVNPESLEADIKNLFKVILENKEILPSPANSILHYLSFKKILRDADYITEDGELTTKGKIASCFKFNNPIFLTEFVLALTDESAGKIDLANIDVQHFASFISLLAENKETFNSKAMEGLYKIDAFEKEKEQLLPFAEIFKETFTKLEKMQPGFSYMDFNEKPDAKKEEPNKKADLNLATVNFFINRTWTRPGHSSFGTLIKKNEELDPADILKVLKTTLNLLKHMGEAAATVRDENGQPVLGEKITSLIKKARGIINRDIVKEIGYKLVPKATNV